MTDNKINFFLQKNFLNELKGLPWSFPLEKWEEKGVEFFSFRKGLSRHPVNFIKGSKHIFAIKETNELMAKKEVNNYEKLLLLGIHTLVSLGYIVAERKPIEVKTKVGSVYERNETAFVVTLLENKALPDSYLYKLNFKERNKKIIWNSVAELLAVLHFNNVYWGDPSLANMLIRFFKVRDAKGRIRTELKAVLADAETVEFIPEISKRMRKEELNFFFESMNWLNRDFIKSGMTRQKFSTKYDKKYILKKYRKHYKLLIRIKKFEIKTGINVKKHFHSIKDFRSLTSIKKQIDEHKWYLSEKAGREVPLKEASQKWLDEIFYPILNEFEKLNVFEYFPFKTSTGLYVDILTHKYYMSQKAGRDVGIEKAIIDYTNKFSEDIYFISVIKRKLNKIRNYFYKENGSKKTS